MKTKRKWPQVCHLSKDEGYTDDAVRIAKSRIAPLLLNWHLMDYNIIHLLASCYLQGVRDTADALVILEEKSPVTTDYQI